MPEIRLWYFHATFNWRFIDIYSFKSMSTEHNSIFDIQYYNISCYWPLPLLIWLFVACCSTVQCVIYRLHITWNQFSICLTYFQMLTGFIFVECRATKSIKLAETICFVIGLKLNSRAGFFLSLCLCMCAVIHCVYFAQSRLIQLKSDEWAWIRNEHWMNAIFHRCIFCVNGRFC